MSSALSASKPTEIDKRWMRAAIAQSLRAEGRTASNPPVGCIILDKHGRLCAATHTARRGVPHAETQALKTAGSAARGGTMYVTLEPCVHMGKTPPCIDEIIAAQIARLVVAVGDPDERVNGRGLVKAKASGLVVDFGVEADAAHTVLSGFLYRVKYGRPYVSLKTAVSLDGAIALVDGQKRWLTGNLMRHFVHELRSRCDALLTGVGTILADNPKFTCREPSFAIDTPSLFIFDSQLRTPTSSKIFRVRQRAVTIFCTREAKLERREALVKVGAEVINLPADQAGKIDIKSALCYLGVSGINRVMVEAGTSLTTAFLVSKFVDKIYWTQSPYILGSDSMPVVGNLKLVALPSQNLYTQTRSAMIGQDHLRVFVQNVSPPEKK